MMSADIVRNVTDVPMTLGQRLKYAMRLRAFTTNRLNEAADLPTGEVSRLANDRRPRPSVDHLEKLAVILRISIDWLRFGRGPRPVEGGEATTTKTAPDRSEPLNPYARIRARADFQELPEWAQTFWAAQVQPLTGSRQTDRVKEARLLDELDAIIRQVASGELTEENAVTDTGGIAPTPPRKEPPPTLPLAKGLDEHGRPVTAATRADDAKGRGGSGRGKRGG